MPKWKRIKSETVYDSKYFRVKKDLVELPDGSNIDWTYWDSRDSGMVLGMTRDKKLVMIRQYRYMVNDEVIEFPSGYNEPSETIKEGAQREFEEETGYECKDELIGLGSFYETCGQLNRRIHLFFSKNVQESEQKLDRGENGYEDIKVVLIDFDDAVQLASENKIVSMGSALAVLLLKTKAEKGEIEI